MEKDTLFTDNFIWDTLNENHRSDNHYMNSPLRRAVMAGIINQLKPEDERVAPDTRGCETIFANAFVTEEMRWDFPLIVRDFLKHEGTNIEKYKDLSYASDMPKYSNLEEFWKRTMVHAIFRGFREGSDYCKRLLQYLFKTYHKNLYKTFKRFSVISFDEVISLSEMDDEYMDTYMISVILCMAEVFGVKIKSDCDALYLFLEEKCNEMERDSEVDYISFPDGLIDECKKQIEELFGSDLFCVMKKKYKSEKFEYRSLQYFGYPEDFILMNKEPSKSILMELVRTLAILKMSYPNKDFTADQILQYSNMFDAVSAITNTANEVYNFWIDIFNLGDDAFYYDGEVLFDPSKIEVRSSTPTKKNVTEVKIIEKSKDERTYSQEVLLAEIDELRNKLHAAEREKKNLIHDLQETRREIQEQKVLEKELIDCKNELTALRSHLYHFTEYDEPAEETSLEMMTEALKKKKVTIIGGHVNWVQKIKKIFPEWNYISAGVSVSNSSRWVTGADYIYFYTDTISHSVYNTYMQLVREKNLQFGYIHGVNTHANIKQMWEEVCSSGM